MDPFTATLLLLAVAGTGQAIGGYLQYQAYQDAADVERARAAHDAQVAQQQAKQEALNRRTAEAEEIRQARRRRATIEAIYARSGVLLTGTPSEWLVEQAGVDAWNREQGNLASRQTQTGLLDQARMIEWKGRQRARAYRQQGTAALIGGFTDMAGLGAQAGMAAVW